MKRIFTLLSFIICSTILFAQPMVSTYVGTGTAGQISSGVPRLSAALDMPYGVAMDGKGVLWLSEEGGNGFGFVIKMIQLDGTARVRAGGVGQDCFKNGSSTATRFSQPRGLAVDANNNIYVADYGNSVIRRISPFASVSNAQTVSTYAGRFDSNAGCYDIYPGYVNGTLKLAQFNGPSDVAYDKATGAMYVADAMNHCIRKIANGQVTTLAGHPDSGGYKDGTVANAKFNMPTGVFVAANGDVYVADHNNSRIRKISAGLVTTVVSGLWTPDDVWVATNGDIYFTDQHRIRKYTLATSKLSTYAGSDTPNDNGNIDGFGTDARFDMVKGLVADTTLKGVFYVADQSNHKIRKVINCNPYVPAVIGYGGENRVDTSYTCTGDTIYLTTDSAFSSYKWSTGETTRTIFKTSSTSNITCTVLNTDGCQGISNHHYVRISTLNPSIIVDGPTTFCPGGNVTLVGPPDYFTYKWMKNGITYDSGHNQSIKVTTSGNYVLYGIIGACYGSSAPITVTVSLNMIPTIKILKGDSNLCSTDTLVVESLGSHSTYIWKKNGTAIGTGKSISITQAGDYTLYITETGGCSGTSYPMHVTIVPGPAIPTFTVNKDTLTSTAAITYQWYCNNVQVYAAVQRIHIAKKPGSYFVEIGNANGCKSRSLPANVLLSVLELSNDLKFDVYPNPTTGKLIVSGTLVTSGDFNIRVVDMLGKSVFNNSMNLVPGKFEKQIDLQGNPSGLYFVIINSNGKQGTMKLILK